MKKLKTPVGAKSKTKYPSPGGKGKPAKSNPAQGSAGKNK